MKVEVKKITGQVLKQKAQVQAVDWNLDGFDIKYIGQIRLEGSFHRYYNQIVSSVDVITRRQFHCSRCLIEACQVKIYNFQKEYPIADLGDFLDTGEDIRQEVLLNFSPRVLCSLDCCGLCPGCGKNLNWEKCSC